MEFTFSPLDLKDVILIKRKVFSDKRGSLIKEFEKTPFERQFSTSFKEEYVSVSRKSVLRGIHFQRDPKPQGKYVSVLRGSIFDVAVDIRRASETYLMYTTVYLDAENAEALWIPEGFAHGFVSLEDDTVVVNRCTNEYDQALEGGLLWNDKELGINWPVNEPLLSEKDLNWKPLRLKEKEGVPQ
jgi:dTDP-4-dehydrorhamnose 3,5-epimerase